MPQFDVSSFSSQIFWLFTIEIFLYFLVSKFIAPKAESILTARNTCMEGNIKHAQEYKDKAKSLELFNQTRLKEVNLKAEEMKDQSLAFLDEHFSREQKELLSSLEARKKDVFKEIDSYIDDFHVHEPESCVKLASFIIKKLTNSPADEELLKNIHKKVMNG